MKADIPFHNRGRNKTDCEYDKAVTYGWRPICPLCGSKEGFEWHFHLFEPTTVTCKSCDAMWETHSKKSLWPNYQTLIKPSSDGRGEDLIGEEHPNAFWLGLVPLDKEVQERTARLMDTYLSKCPICKSGGWHEVRLNIDSLRYIAISCRLCNVVFTSEDWDEKEGEEHTLRLESAAKGGKGATLLRQFHSIRFWQKMRIEELETPEDIQREQRWLIRKIESIGVSLPSSGMHLDTIWRLFDPVGALAIRGLPDDPFVRVRAFETGWANLELEMEARAEEKASEYEKIVFTSRLSCPSCNKEIKPDFNLCPYCGVKLVKGN